MQENRFMKDWHGHCYYFLQTDRAMYLINKKNKTANDGDSYEPSLMCNIENMVDQSVEQLVLIFDVLYAVTLLLDSQCIDRIIQAENRITQLEKNLQENNKLLLSLKKYIKSDHRYTTINNVIYPNLNKAALCTKSHSSAN